MYVLWSASARKFYIGISEDPTVRLLQHISGVLRLYDKKTLEMQATAELHNQGAKKRNIVAEATAASSS